MDTIQGNVTGRAIPRLGLNPDEAAVAAGVSRTRIFEAIRDGALTARKTGKATSSRPTNCGAGFAVCRHADGRPGPTRTQPHNERPRRKAGPLAFLGSISRLAPLM